MHNTASRGCAKEQHMLTHFDMLLSVIAKHKREAEDLWKAVFITRQLLVRVITIILWL